MPDDDPFSDSDNAPAPSRRSCLVTLVAIGVATVGLILLSLLVGAALALASGYLSTLLGVGAAELVLASVGALVTLTIVLGVVVIVVMQREHGSFETRIARAISEAAYPAEPPRAPTRRRRKNVD